MKLYTIFACLFGAVTQASALSCNYQGTIYKICMNANAWSYENGGVCVGVTRCVQQSPPYGIVVGNVTPKPTTTMPTTPGPTTKPPTPTPSPTTKTPTPTPSVPRTTPSGPYEAHPSLMTKVCTKSGCVQEETKANLNLGYRPQCNDPTTVNTQKCHIPVEDYSRLYGINVQGDSVKLELFTGSGGVGGGFMIMQDDWKYRMYHLVNKEFTFDIDTSKMPCGVNGALYFSEMDGNDKGAQYGSGYCDAQCPSSKCCQEMDIWEGNKAATGWTPHPCYHEGPYICAEPQECGRDSYRYQGECDMNGCGINPYALSHRNFYGPGSSFALDSSRPFTVVTQFISTDGTDNGDLAEIKRFYVQDGKRVDQPGIGGQSTPLNDAQCAILGSYNNNVFGVRGGMAQMGRAYKNGMVLIMSIWIDSSGNNMSWLDSGDAGPCIWQDDTEANIRAKQPDTSVIFSNIRTGDIGTTTM